MFELNGKKYSTQQLKASANKQGLSFEDLLSAMKNRGMVEVTESKPNSFTTKDPIGNKNSSAYNMAANPDSVQSIVPGSSQQEKTETIDWFDQTWFGRGYAAASTTGEATDLFMEGSDVNMETIQEFIKAKEGEARAHVPSEAMNRFQKKYQEEGSGWTAFFRGVRDEPGLLSELFVQSLGTQIGTFFDSDKARIATVAGGAAGAGATAYLGYGAIAGGVAGAMGGLATSMETALTFGELIETELAKDELEFTDVNIKALLESSKGQSIRNKAIGRGLTIGAIEALTGGVAGRVTTGVLKGAKTAGKIVSKTRKVAAAGAGIVVEGVGGGVGEVGGRLAAGQEMDAAEIGFEAITGTTTAPLNVGGALLSYKKPVYKLNGKVVEYKDMKDFVETADDIDVAKANIVMENDLTGLDAVAYKKQTDAITDSQVDVLVTDKKDRSRLVQLEYERRKAEFDAKKKGIDQVPGAEEKLAEVQAEIDGIIGKYDGAIDKSLTEGAAEVRKAQRENNLQSTIDFLQNNKKYAGKDVIIAADSAAAQVAHDKAVEEYNLKNPDNKLGATDVTGADGFIVGDVIVINKDIAGQTGQINVGAHELLHGIVAKHMKGLTTEERISLISDFTNTITKDQKNYIQTEIERRIAAGEDLDINTTEEWLTVFSDGITKGDIKFDEGVFDKLKNFIQEIARKVGYFKEFENGRQVYNFMKDYQKSVKAGGEISTRAQRLAGGGTTATSTSKSMSTPLEAINQLIPKNIKTKKEYDAFVQDRRAFPAVFMATMGDGVISNYVKSKSIGGEYQGAIESVQNRLTNFDPEATRADGTTVGPEGFGEFIFANTRFGKLDSKKKLFEAGEKAKREESIDSAEARQIEDKPTTKRSEPRGQKARILKSLADVNLDNKEIISSTARAEINALIEQNPKNLEAQITSIIDKEITKAVKAQMGKISNVQGEVVISEEYKAFIALNYENIVQSLDVDTIKNNYKTLFELTEIGKEDRRTRKSDKPSLKKDSNYRKAIFKIETNKAKFTKFFTEGGYTTLLARQKGLANQIAKGITEDVINNEIIENSNNMDAVIQAEIADYGNKLNRQKNEVRGNYSDQIKFSKTVNAKHFNELINEGINGEVGSDVWISLVKIANPIIVKEAESIIELHNADYTKETSGFKDRVRRLVFGKGIKEKYFARPTNKNHPDSINELLDFTESLAEIMDPALVSTGLFEDMFGFTYRYGDKNRIGKDAHGRVVDSTSKRKSDKNFIDKHGFDPSTAKKYMFNSTFGIMGRINTITSKSFNTVKEKLQAILDKEGANIEQANKQNYKVLEYIITKAIQVVNKNPDKLVGALRWLESATSTVKGLRGLTRLTHLDVIAESQEPSIEHPDYKETYKVALESVKKKNKTKKLNLTDSQIKEAAKESALAQLKPKGEHLKPSANLMASFAELIIKYSKLDMSNPKTLTEFKKDFNKLTDGYDQALGNKSTYAIVDKTMGSQAEGDVRLLTGLPKAIAKRFFHISGVQSAGYISRTITQSKEFTKLSNRADKAAKLSSAINFSRSANNPTKGITVLDFDDTLATTKSGVRANIPNTDGLPKPGRKVIFLAGGAGSGKGNVISKLGLESQGFKVVNSDISLEWLKKNSGLPENMNDFTEKQRSTLGSLQHQARGIARRKMMKYQGEGGGVVVDGTGGSIKSMENLVNEFKAKGYDVSMVFTETSLDVALERNAARKERSLLDKIVERNHEAVQGNKDGFKEMFGDRFMEVNTDNLSQKDAMPSKLTNKMNDFVSGYENRRLDAEEFARDGASILEQGGTFDFSEFNEVVEGQTAPLFEKAMKLQGKFGNKDMFVLTARPAESADAIHAFLTANGLNIPLKNITGLANSTAEAKALWMVEKVSEGYNDFYFADDAIQNVKAVDNILEQFDVKRKVQQARADFVKGDPQVVKLLEESSMNDVKNVDRLTKPGTYDNIKFSKAHRAEYENTISKNRPDLVKSKLVSKTIDRMFDYIDSLDVPTDKRRKYEKITTKWLATSNVKLGEDGYKIQQAVELAEKHNKDIFSYNNPNEIIEAYAGKSKAEPTNPKNVKEFGEGRVFNKKHGITVHEVEDTKEGMMAVRKVADTHWGPKSNPWCIIARSEKQRVEPRQYGYESVATKSEAQARKQQLESEGFMVEIRAHKKDYRGIYPGKSIDGKRVDMRYELDIKEVKEGPGIMEDAWQNWTVYDKSRKYIVFQNGRLSSFYADDQYWDRMDSPTDAPVIQIKEGNVTSKVELVPIGDGNVDEFVMETRTTSKDKKTVTTEVLHETQDGFAEGTKIVENRVNGITIKSTRTGANGNVSEIINFDKSGKATNNVTFNPEGQARAINRYGMPFGEMSINDIVQEKGDLLSHEVNDGDISYYYGDVLINGQKTEIGWGMPSNLDLRDFVKTSPNGEVRADIKKILEVDPNTKGLPKSNVMFSKSMDQNFNDILENVTGIDSEKRFSAIKGRKRGESKGKFRFFVPPSHEDFVGLLYNFLGKGKEGNAHRDFFEQALVRPLNRANREFDTARQSVANDYKELNKQFSEVKDKLARKTLDGDFTFQDAIRVYLWDKHGHKIPGLTETDQAKLVEMVQSDLQLKTYAETLNVISKQETYVNPTEGWNSGDIRMDLDDATGRVGRKQFFSEFIENADIIFSEENLNKIEAGYGKEVRESLEDILYRIKTGRNRPSGQNAQVNKLMNYLNGSVGTVMFFNMRSALLQQMSIVNYINFADNNVFAVAKAFANQPQYWADWAFIFNSDMLKQRRGGIQTDINGADLAASLRNSKDITRKLISKLLEIGFLPTQIGDNIAIATGGAAYYRNRINTYLKQGLSQKEAEAKAFTDFQDITQSTQQSARPDMVSKQQASVIGKVILNFQNVTSQFNRLGKKAFQDIYNRRITKPNTTQMQSDISNASRITYYFAIQNMIFYTLQTALFAMMFGDDEEDDNKLFLKKKERLINGSIDSVLRGTGLIGGVVATLKNVAIAFARQRDVKYNPDESAVALEALNLSPVLGIKMRKIVNAEKTLNYNKKVIKEMETFDIDNPQWSAVTNYTEALTNVPLNRLYNKTQNVRQALNNDHSAWERSLMFLGWSQYNLDLENKRMKGIKEDVKAKSKEESKQRAKDKRKKSKNKTKNKSIFSPSKSIL